MSRAAFVTGATGFVGLNLVEALLERGWRVTAMHRRGSDLTFLRRLAAERVEGDVVDAPSVRRAMPEIVRLATTTTFCDCSKAVRELGLRVVPLRDMVADCAAWMTGEGLLPG